MAESVDNFEIMREQVVNNLRLLSFEDFIRKRKENIEINPDIFRQLTPKTFHLITYFLFQKLNPEECSKRFNGCFPVLDRKQEGEFRQTTNKWLQEITSKETTHLPRVVPIYFQRFTPESNVCHLYLEFTNYLIIKELQKMSSVSQPLVSIDDPNGEELIAKTLTEYEIIKSEIKVQTEEWIQKMTYFAETYSKLRDQLNILTQNKDRLSDELRKKYGLSSDSEVKPFIEEYFNGLNTSVDNLKTNLLEMNELIENNWKHYSIAFESQNDSSSESKDLSIDLKDYFKGNNTFSFAAQEFKSCVRRYDTVLQKVSVNSLEKLSNVSIEYSTELENYKKHLSEVTSELKIMLDQISCLSKKRKAELLSDPKMIERRKRIAERIPDISKLMFKFEPKPRIIKDNVMQTIEMPKPSPELNDNINASLIDDISPIFISRPSLCDYSFQVMDISTCHYIPPNSCPLSMNDSHLFSPIENKTKSVFDSK